MKSDIRDRLKRLGVHKGAGKLRTPASGPRRGRSIPDRDDLSQADGESWQPSLHPPPPDALQPLWNLEQETPLGVAYVRRTRFAASHHHGNRQLDRALHQPTHLLARLSNGVSIDLRHAIFLDTETTGLVGGTGTLVFLVGVGYFVYDSVSDDSAPTAFVVDQYFLRDPAEEAGMLVALDNFINQHPGLVTFNGRGFDIPLLETRYTLARIAPSLNEHDHLDLLLPARRAWRNELTSCSLGSLEFHLLEVRRDQQDIPGFIIPSLYREYLRTADPTEMHRVMYHNLHDILSMVTLVSRLCDAVNTPASLSEYLAIGQYYEQRGQRDEAEQVYSAALAWSAEREDAGSQLQRRVMAHLAGCLKRDERHEQAIPYWRQLGEAGDWTAWLELAKHYEWHDVNLEQALVCARSALALALDPWTRAEINHRIDRLARKIKEDDQLRSTAAET